MKSKQLQPQTPTSVRLSAEELRRVRTLARKEDRSLASMLRVLLAEALARRNQVAA